MNPPRWIHSRLSPDFGRILADSHPIILTLIIATHQGGETLSDSKHSKNVAIFGCSPRACGNTDQAASMIKAAAAETGAQGGLYILRHYDIHHCLACYRCEHDPRRRCYLSDSDQTDQLFEPLLSADLFFFTVPIFFYHVPSHFKAFIDRSQSYYLRSLAGDPAMAALPRRTAHPVLIAGRPAGDRLFEGTLLTMKYFLQPFNIELAPPLLLRGVDTAEALASDTEASGQVWEYARSALSEI